MQSIYWIPLKEMNVFSVLTQRKVEPQIQLNKHKSCQTTQLHCRKNIPLPTEDNASYSDNENLIKWFNENYAD